MSNIIRGPVAGVTLCRANRPGEPDSYVLLPSLGELLGVPGFGGRNPICLPGTCAPLDGWTLFGLPNERRLALH